MVGVLQGGPKLRLACGKVNLDRAAENGVGFPASHEEMYGSDVPSAQPPPHQQAWVSSSHEDGVGTRRAVAPTEKRAQASRAAPAVEEPESLTREQFPRRARLTRASDLTNCWEEGRRWRTPHLELAWRPNQVHHPRVGIIVGRFGFSAVARNRLRRRIREILRRESLPHLPPVDVVIRTKRSAYTTPFAVLRADVTSSVTHIT